MASNFMFYFNRLLFLFFLVFVVKATSVNGDEGNYTTTTAKPSTNVTTPISKPNTTTVKPTTNSSTTVAPTTKVHPTTQNHTSTPTTSNYSTPLPSTQSTPVPTNHTTPLPSNFTTAPPSNYTTLPTPGPTGHSKDCKACEDMLDKERRLKWVAVAFDIIFAIAFVVMLILYLRQRKMYREMEGDGSLSRLI